MLQCRIYYLTFFFQIIWEKHNNNCILIKATMNNILLMLYKCIWKSYISIQVITKNIVLMFHITWKKLLFVADFFIFLFPATNVAACCLFPFEAEKRLKENRKHSWQQKQIFLRIYVLSHFYYAIFL